jgi:hypothetical protein
MEALFRDLRRRGDYGNYRSLQRVALRIGLVVP